MGKRSGATLPLKFKLYHDNVEVTSKERRNQILGECGPACPKILVYGPYGQGEELPPDPWGDWVGEADQDGCFRYSETHWIYNLRLDGFGAGWYQVKVKIGEHCTLLPGNNEFQVK